MWSCCQYLTSQCLSPVVWDPEKILYVRNFPYKIFSWVLKLGRIIMMESEAGGNQDICPRSSLTLEVQQWHNGVFMLHSTDPHWTSRVPPFPQTFLFHVSLMLRNCSPWDTMEHCWDGVCAGWEGCWFENAHLHFLHRWGRAWFQLLVLCITR